MDLTNRLPFVVTVDDCDEPADAIDAMSSQLERTDAPASIGQYL